MFTGVLAETALDTEQISKAAGPSVVVLTAEGADGKALGTGFFVTENGFIVTNAHVIEDATRIMAKSNQGAFFPVKEVLALDKERDLAVIRVVGKNLPALKLADEESIKQGAKVAVLGNPIGLELSITEGIISAIRDDGNRRVIQITAPISPGSSGSPVLNSEGSVVGVASFKLLKGESLNFAVTVQHVKTLLNAASTKTSSPSVAGDSTSENIYEPDATVLGSASDDAKVMQESDYSKLRELEMSQQPSLIIGVAKRLAEKYPQSALAQRRLSDAYYYAKLWQESLAACKKAIDLDPKNVRGWENLASVFEMTGDAKSAAKCIKKAVLVKPEDAKVWITYSLLTAKEDPESAANTLHHAEENLKSAEGVDDETRTYPLRSSLSDAYLLLGRTQDAYTQAQMAIKEQALRPEGHLSLARAAMELKKFDEVKPALDEVAKLTNPRPIEIYHILGRCYSQQGLKDEAIETMEKALEISSQDTMTLTLISIFHFTRSKSTEDREKALSYAGRLSELAPKLGEELKVALRKFEGR